MEQVKGGTADEPGALRSAVRRARVEQAERSDVTAELRGAEFARLDMLFEAFKPILAQVPAEIDLFDAGFSYGERPRLFIDMIAFVEMARDRHTYRFMQENRAGRALIAESADLPRMAEAVTLYLGRRVVEREKALARDAQFQPQDTLPPMPEALPPPRPDAVPAPSPLEDDAPADMPRRAYSGVDVFFAFVLGGVFMLALFVIAAWLDMKTLWPFGKLLG